MRELQCARQSENERYVLLLHALFGQCVNSLWWPCGKAAGQGRIVVDVEFQQVEEGV